MNKLQLNFVSGLALLGLEAKAQDVLTKEFKAQLTTFDKAQEAVDKVEETVEAFNTLSANMSAQSRMLEAEITELSMGINKLNVSSDIVSQVMEINKQIEAKQETIKAVASAQLSLGGKAKADTMDALAEGYKAVNALSADIYSMIETVTPVISGSNKAQIVKALKTVENELNGFVYALESVAHSLNVANQTHKGVRLSISTLGVISAIAMIESK
ncbi:hypothetical protein ACQKFG_05660 [Peribacillus sp. NPDC076916]|uniref:hypothetical protein n=1 Tax=Peribacillus sp. NPDC076916 TaxID=3390608 RepID=UPI003D01A229